MNSLARGRGIYSLSYTSVQSRKFLAGLRFLCRRDAKCAEHSGQKPRAKGLLLQSPSMSRARARKIKLLLFDVDGVMTDGKLWFFPATSHPSNTGSGAAPGAPGNSPPEQKKLEWGTVESKGFHAHDGTAISLARLGGLKTGLITRRMSETVAVRARDLRLDHAYQGIMVKIRAFEEILEKEQITASEVAYVGDDVIDLPIMRRCGFAVAVSNAREQVKQEAHWITSHAGGDGAIRDAVEYILKAQGRWDSAVKEYLEHGD